MRYIAILAGLFLLAVTTAAPQPSLADAAFSAEKPVMAKTSPQQRALAEVVSARIRSALDGEPYALNNNCDGKDCTVSESR